MKKQLMFFVAALVGVLIVKALVHNFPKQAPDLF